MKNASEYSRTLNISLDTTSGAMETALMSLQPAAGPGHLNADNNLMVGYVYHYGVPMNGDGSQDRRKDIPIEQPVDRIPPVEEQNKINNVIQWADLIHGQAHSPWGIDWQTIYTAILAMSVEREWADSATINPRYRTRVDTPMDKSEAKDMPDHFPEDWSKT